jgi:hypothetical protein
MGKRFRRRAGSEGGLPAGKLQAPTSKYEDPEAGTLELRGSLTLKARSEYAAVFSGGLQQEDAWQRATELLFERLAVSWTISDVKFDNQKELLGRYRVGSPAERRFVRDSLRAHVVENFPDVQAP